MPQTIGLTSSVASPGFGVRRGTKLRENNLRVTQKYHEIHAINSDRAIGLYRIFLLDRRESNVRVCAFWSDHKKIKQLEVKGARAEVLHSWWRQWTRYIGPLTLSP